MSRQNGSFTFYSVIFYPYQDNARAIMKALCNEALARFKLNLAACSTLRSKARTDKHFASRTLKYSLQIQHIIVHNWISV